MQTENEEVKYYQPRFARWIKSDKWELIAEELPNIHMNVITHVMNAKKDGDCSWIIWYQCDKVLDSIKQIAKRLRY